MARADKFHQAVPGRPPHDESGELPGQGALAKNAVAVFHHAIERQAGFRQAAKSGVQVAHQHGSGHTFAGNVSEQEKQSVVRFEQVAVIAAHHARRLIVKLHVPARRGEAGFG